MTDEIQKSSNSIEYTAGGKRIRASREDVFRALAPIFAYFPNLEMKEETFNAYYMTLCILDPNKLASAVMIACEAHEYPTQLVTVAAIRKAYEGEQRAPAARNDVALEDLKPVPTRMFHLAADEDRSQRLERLRQTKNWDKLYS